MEIRGSPISIANLWFVYSTSTLFTIILRSSLSVNEEVSLVLSIRFFFLASSSSEWQKTHWCHTEEFTLGERRSISSTINGFFFLASSSSEWQRLTYVILRSAEHNEVSSHIIGILHFAFTLMLRCFGSAQHLKAQCRSSIHNDRRPIDVILRSPDTYRDEEVSLVISLDSSSSQDRHQNEKNHFNVLLRRA